MRRAPKPVSLRFRLQDSGPALRNPIGSDCGQAGAVWSRRALVVGATLLTILPHAAEGALRCGPEFAISAIVPMTGAAAMTGDAYRRGIAEAVERAEGQGCEAGLSIRDSRSSELGLVEGALVAYRKGALVLMAPFGPIIARDVARKAESALVFDLLGPALVGVEAPTNLVTLPYELFFQLDPAAHAESLRTAGRVAAEIVIETVVGSPPISAPGDLSEAMTGRHFPSPSGTLVLDGRSGAFGLLQ